MSGEAPRGMPTTWAALAERFRAHPERANENFAHFAAKLERKGIKPLDLGVPLKRCVNIAAGSAVLGAEAQARSMLDTLHPPVSAVLASRSPVMDTLALPRLAALSAQNLADCAGWESELKADVGKLLTKLVAKTNQTEDETRWIVFAMLAHGRVEALPELLLTERFDAPPDPAAHYEFNIHGLQVHLGRAIAHGAGLDSVRAAWADYLGLFPRLYGANVTTYAELLLCARAVHAVIGGAPIAGTLAWLRSEIG